MELVPKAEFSIVTRASSKAWIPELIAAAVSKSLKPTSTSSPPRSATGTLGLLTLGLAGSFLIGAPLMAWSSRPCSHSMCRHGLRTFPDPSRPLSKARCGADVIRFSGRSSDRRQTRHMPFAGQSMWSRKARRLSGAAKTPKRCWIRSQRIRCPDYGTWRSSPRCSTASPVSARY